MMMGCRLGKLLTQVRILSLAAIFFEKGVDMTILFYEYPSIGHRVGVGHGCPNGYNLHSLYVHHRGVAQYG